MFPQKLEVLHPCKIGCAFMQILSRIYIDSRWNLHGHRGEFAWTEVGICMEGTYMTLRGNLK